MRLFFLSVLSLLPLVLSSPTRFLMGRPPGEKSPRTAQSTPPTPPPSTSPDYGIVLDGPFLKLDSRVPISSCPQITTEYLRVIQTSSNHLRIPHSRIITNGQPCGPLPENATMKQLLTDSYMELIPIDHLLTSDIADEYDVLGAYKKLTSKRAYTFRFFQYVLEERENYKTGPMTYIGYERYATRKCGDVDLGIQSLVFFGTVLDMPVNLTGLVPRLEQGAIRRDLRLDVGREFHITFSLNGTDAEHVCPSVLRRRTLLPIPEVRECFPAGAKVVSERGVIDVADVEVGDRLFDGAGFSDVVMLTHRDHNATGSFAEIILDNGLKVQASMGHYLDSPEGLIKARDISPSTWLHTTQGMKRVSKVSIVRGKGLYNMQTASGKVVVDGVVASCYSEAVAPFVGHALLAPVRLMFIVCKRVISLYKVFWICLFGMVSQLDARIMAPLLELLRMMLASSHHVVITYHMNEC